MNTDNAALRGMAFALSAMTADDHPYIGSEDVPAEHADALGEAVTAYAQAVADLIVVATDAGEPLLALASFTAVEEMAEEAARTDLLLDFLN